MPTAPTEPTPTGWYGTDPQKKWANDSIVAFYQEFLGRVPSAREVLEHLGGGQWYQRQNVEWAREQILNSEEARAYAARNQPGAPTPTPPTDTTLGTGMNDIKTWLETNAKDYLTKGLMA